MSRNFLGLVRGRSASIHHARHRQGRRLGFETLDDRTLLSSGSVGLVETASALNKIPSNTAGTTVSIHEPTQDLSVVSGTGHLAGTALISTSLALPLAPSFTAVAASTSQIKLAWKSVPGALGYGVAEWINGGWELVAGLGGTATSETVGSLRAGTTYNFDVGAFNLAGTSWASYQSATTLSAGMSPPVAPSFTATAASTTQINLAWSSVAGATEYVVNEWVNGAWAQIANPTSGSNSDAVNGLAAKTTYTFEVGATNTAGTTWASSQSATTQAAPVSLPAAPTVTAGTLSNTQINLSWNSVAGATSYVLDEWAQGSPVKGINFPAGTISYSATGLNSGTNYFFTLSAVNSAGMTSALTVSAATDPFYENTPNWAGYVAESNLGSPAANSVTLVGGTWQVPAVSMPSNGTGYSAVWVGIDGGTGAVQSTVEQIGTDENVINGVPQYFAWWEMYSTSGAKTLGEGYSAPISSMSISPGDTVHAFVQYETSGTHTGQFLLSIDDLSRSASDSFQTYESSAGMQSPVAQRNCAEWVVEAPQLSNGSIATLANFGSVSFSNASAMIDGQLAAIDGPSLGQASPNSPSWQVQCDTMKTSSGTTEASVSGLTDATQSGFTTSSFTVAYGVPRPTTIIIHREVATEATIALESAAVRSTKIASALPKVQAKRPWYEIQL